MLYLSRKIGESIVINNSIELTVIEVRGKTVKLGFMFPPEATVLRKEIYEKIMAENVAASRGTPQDSDFEGIEIDLSFLDNPPPADKK
jgi:carbon storage regulator